MTVHPPINDAEFNTVIAQRDSARSIAAGLEAENARLIDGAADVEVLRGELAAANAELARLAELRNLLMSGGPRGGDVFAVPAGVHTVVFPGDGENMHRYRVGLVYSGYGPVDDQS